MPGGCCRLCLQPGEGDGGAPPPKGCHSLGFPYRDQVCAPLSFDSFVTPVARLELPPRVSWEPGRGSRAHQPTFALPVGVSREADVAPVFAVELCHQRLVGVSDEQDG